MRKLVVENVMDLERISVRLLDTLTSEHLYICENGQIGRGQGAYAIIREKLEEVAAVTESEMTTKDVKSDS